MVPFPRLGHISNIVGIFLCKKKKKKKKKYVHLEELWEKLISVEI